MKLHLDSPATSSCRHLASRSNPVRLGVFALAVVFTATQMPAEDAQAVAPQAATLQAADANTSSVQTSATNAGTAPLTTAPSNALKTEANALPEAPTTKAANQEAASVTMPPNVRAMLNDATERSQSLQSTPKSKGIQRPGMLIMGIAGVPLIAFGTYVMTRHVSTNSGLKDGFGAAFLVPGAAMSGFGFYLAFKPKNK